MSRPTQDEVDEVLSRCIDQADEGGSRFRGMTYEEGVEACIRWMQGDGPNPLDD